MTDPFRRLIAMSMGKFSDGTSAPPLVATPDTGDVPLTFFQEMRWNRLRQNPTDRYYLDGFGIKLTGALDEAALRASLDDIVTRHDALRLRYRFDAPIATFEPERRLELQWVDCTGMSDHDVGARAVELIYAPLNISRDPVFRPFVLRLAPDVHILLLTFHTVALNRPGAEIVTGDWAACYSARRAGEPVPPWRTTFKFSDFARWQRGWLAGDELERRIARWTDRLAGTRPVRLPTDKPRPETASPARLWMHRAQLPEALAAEVVEFGRRRGTTFSIMLAALAVVLHARTGDGDVTLKVITQPLHRATHGVAGVFVGLAIVRIRLDDDPSLATVIERTTTALYDALEDQMLPWAKVPGSLIGEPDIVIDAMTPAGKPATWSGLQTGGVHLENHRELPGRYDLECFIWLRSPTDQILWFIYNADLFEHPTMERFANDVHRVAAAFVKHDATPLSALVRELAG